MLLVLCLRSLQCLCLHAWLGAAPRTALQVMKSMCGTAVCCLGSPPWLRL